MKSSDNIRSHFNVICLETEAFYALVEQVLDKLEAKRTQPQKWIDDDETMSLLNIRSKTTLQKLRDEGKIRYSQLGKKIILYDRDSILEYIESNAKETF